MLFLYAPLGRWLLAANNLTVPWETIVLSVLIYVGLPLLAGARVKDLDSFATRAKAYFENVFLKYLSPISVIALLTTLVLLFLPSKGDLIVRNPPAHSADCGAAVHPDQLHFF